jgi:hypothetical protein
MATYLVSYDLDKPGAEYDKLEEWLRNSDAQQVLNSLWILKSSEIEANLERIVMGLIVESTDSILVLRVTPGFAFWNRLNISDADFKHHFLNP